MGGWIPGQPRHLPAASGALGGAVGRQPGVAVGDGVVAPAAADQGCRPLGSWVALRCPQPGVLGVRTRP
eukprot:6131775-Alexandrium_andersonii.AAC.1